MTVSQILKKGVLLNQFSLTVNKSHIDKLGNISAINPTFWSPPLIYISKSNKGFLIVSLLEDMRGKFAKIIFHMELAKAGPNTGNIQLKYYPQKNKPAVTINQKVTTNASILPYTFETKNFEGDSQTLELASIDFDSIGIKQVDVEIYQPFKMPK